MASKESPEWLALMRRQLDERLTKFRSIATPPEGWVRTVRESLGMTMAQLGKRLGISAPSVNDLELRERRETISIGKLREAADALECDLKIVFVPRSSLERVVRDQAVRKAHEERARLVQTMSLEGQGAGVEAVLDESRAVEEWLTTRARRLWD